MKNKFITLAAATLALAGCGASAEKLAEIEDYGEIGYADIVSYIVQGYQCRWIGMDPESQGLSAVYRYCSPTAGVAIQDINGDGLKELLIGDDINGTVLLYDIYTINRKDASLIHLARGGERDTFTINGSGTIIENGSNSAFDSFTKAFTIKNGNLEEVKDGAYEESLMKIELENFDKMAKDAIIQCGGYTYARDVTEEEVEMFSKAAEEYGLVGYTPLAVATQVVAGTNYMFTCKCDDESSENNGVLFEITVFKPLPSQGDPTITSITEAKEVI